MKTKRTIWLILFILYVCYALSELYLFGEYIIYTGEGMAMPELGDYIYELVMLITLLGFYGFIGSKKIFHVIFWKSLFVFIVVSAIFQIFTGILANGKYYFSIFIEQPMYLLLYVAIIPSIIAIYIYSFKSKNIWS